MNPAGPVLIIKDKAIRQEKPNGKLRWAVCTDGSEKSFKAFHLLASLIDKNKDEVEAITVEDHNVNIDTTKEAIQQHFE